MSVEALLEALHSSSPVSGLTHSFYRYPARMSPKLASIVIRTFSKKDDWVLDPFMGGGTTIVEAIANGRRALGVDLNSIATFVSTVKTTPLSENDQARIRNWVGSLKLSYSYQNAMQIDDRDSRLKNLPLPVHNTLQHALNELGQLPLPRQQRFARCALLRLGQWAIDCKDKLPNESALKQRLLLFSEEMLEGMNELTRIAQGNGIPKNQITSRRLLLLRSAAGMEEVNEIASITRKPKLVLTSPPYPGVRVLYHRWQVAGRRATPAPYWIINSQDGQYEPYYTMGGVSVSGQQKYFRLLTEVFRSVRTIIDPNAIVIQLTSFADVETQLPAFMQAMERAGFCEDVPVDLAGTDLWRRVPGRRWYNRIHMERGAGQELLLFHRPMPL